MFEHRHFDVDLVRRIDRTKLGWPEPGEAGDDSGLGCNRLYADLRRLSWTEAKRVFELEGELIARMEIAEEIDTEWEAIEEELFESDANLLGLDLGVASTVVCLSAVRCVPFSSCNAAAFGGRHQEAYPLVAFYLRPQLVDLLLTAAVEAGIGFEDNEYGYVVAYADDVRKLRRFAASVMNKRSLFRTVRLSQRVRATGNSALMTEQYKLFFDSD
jgi:hypothetical protein